MSDRPNDFRSTDFPRRDARRFPQHGFPAPGHTAFSAVHHNFPERRRRSFFGASAGTVYLYINPKYFGYKFGMLPLAAGRRFRYNERWKVNYYGLSVIGKPAERYKRMDTPE